MDPESDTWRFLGLIPAIQRYKIHPERVIIYEVTGLNNNDRCWRSQNSIADSSTTSTLILDLIAGDG